MAEQLSKTYFPQEISSELALYRYLSDHRWGLAFHRNKKRALEAHDRRLKKEGRPEKSTAPFVETVVAEDWTENANGEGVETKGDGKGAKPQVDVVSKETLLIKTMDPNFENTPFVGNPRRSIRHNARKIFDEDESVLTLAPVSIRKKINFTKNQLPDEERPRRRFKADRSVKRVKCHCSITIWDNRNGLEEENAKLIENHNSCMVTWLSTADRRHYVDVEMDKPFRITAGALKVPIERDGDSVLGMSDYFMEFKVWPSSKDAAWPPIPIQGRAEGHVNRPNRIAHSIISGSLIAKYRGLPVAPAGNSPLSVFYLDDNGEMRFTKYGLEVGGDWTPSDKAHDLDTPPSDVAWMVDDEGNEFGRKRKRPPTLSSPMPSPRPRKKQAKSTPKQAKPNTKHSGHDPRIEYIWEPAPAQRHLTQDSMLTTTLDGLLCPGCRRLAGDDLTELRSHFILEHSRLNFILESQEIDDHKGLLRNATFRIRSCLPSQRRLDPLEPFSYIPSPDPFDLQAYVNGDRSWTGESPSQFRGTFKRRDRVATVAQSSSAPPSTASTSRISGFVADPFVKYRAENSGHVPSSLVPEFRKAERQKHRPAALVRHTDDNTLTYDSISHRPTYTSEDSMSETDDERDGEWYIQRHLESLDVEGGSYRRSESRKELFRRWDRHRLEEKLDNIAFLSESLVRFVRKHKKWLRNGNDCLRTSWARLLDNLREDKLITEEVWDSVHKLVFEEDNESISDHAQSLNGQVVQNTVNGVGTSHGSGDDDDDDAISTSMVGNAGPTIPTDPALALEAICNRLLHTSSGCCGRCQKPIPAGQQRHAVRCSVRSCPASDVFYHVKCAKSSTAKDALAQAWSCMVCRVKAKLDTERKTAAAAAKGKGKATAT